MFGDEGMREPDAGAGRAAFAAPFIAAGEAAQLRERDDRTELPIQGGEFTQFVGERGKKLALQSEEDRRQIEHDSQPIPTPAVQTHPQKSPVKPCF